MRRNFGFLELIWGRNPHNTGGSTLDCDYNIQIGPDQKQYLQETQTCVLKWKGRLKSLDNGMTMHV